MSPRFLFVLPCALIRASAQAQVCAPGGGYVSHDNLPQVPPAAPTIHDGVTWNGVIPTLGPVVFDWAAQTRSSIALTSHGINTQDLSHWNVVVTSGTLVLTWILEVNLNGAVGP